MENSTEPKKYPPSTKKLKDLEKKGQYPKTEFAEITLEAVVFSLTLMFFVYNLSDIASYLFELALIGSMASLIKSLLLSVIVFIVFFTSIKFTFSIITWGAINKFLVNFHSLGIKFDKLNPKNGFKRMFGLQEIFKSTRKCLELIFLILIFKYLSDVLSEYVSQVIIINNENYFLYILIMSIALSSSVYIIFGMFLSIVDFFIEKSFFMKKHMMTFTEMKNELKETEGSEEIKSERKQKMQEIMAEPVLKGRRPTFAIANPTHILVPICFDYEKDVVPIVLKISTDKKAREERAKLERDNIPVIENIGLARAFYKNVKTGEQFIPKEFYRDVAIILSYLKKKKFI